MYAVPSGHIQNCFIPKCPTPTSEVRQSGLSVVTATASSSVYGHSTTPELRDASSVAYSTIQLQLDWRLGSGKLPFGPRPDDHLPLSCVRTKAYGCWLLDTLRHAESAKVSETLSTNMNQRD